MPHNKTSELIDTLIHKVASINIKVFPIKVVFSLKSSSALGTIRFENNKKNSFLMKLSKKLYDKYKNEYLEHVITHEFAHACVMSHYKKRLKPHGKEWKNIMNFLGIQKPRASTNMFKIRQNGYIWKCLCNNFILGKIKHNNMINKEKYRKFFCRKCREELSFTGEYQS